MAVLHIDIQTAIAATMFLKAFGGLLLIISISFVVFLLACGRNLVHALETTNRIGIVSCWCRRSRAMLLAPRSAASYSRPSSPSSASLWTPGSLMISMHVFMVDIDELYKVVPWELTIVTGVPDSG